MKLRRLFALSLQAHNWPVGIVGELIVLELANQSVCHVTLQTQAI